MAQQRVNLGVSLYFIDNSSIANKQTSRDKIETWSWCVLP